MFLEQREILPAEQERFLYLFKTSVTFGEKKLGWKGSLEDFEILGVKDITCDNLIRKIFPPTCFVSSDFGQFVVNPTRIGVLAQRKDRRSQDSPPQLICLDVSQELALARKTNLYLESCPNCGENVLLEFRRGLRVNITEELGEYRRLAQEVKAKWAQKIRDLYNIFEVPGVWTGRPGARMRVSLGFGSDNSYAVMELGENGAKIVEWNIGSPTEAHLDWLIGLKKRDGEMI